MKKNPAVAPGPNKTFSGSKKKIKNYKPLTQTRTRPLSTFSALDRVLLLSVFCSLHSELIQEGRCHLGRGHCFLNLSNRSEQRDVSWPIVKANFRPRELIGRVRLLWRYCHGAASFFPFFSTVSVRQRPKHLSNPYNVHPGLRVFYVTRDLILYYILHIFYYIFYILIFHFIHHIPLRF